MIGSKGRNLALLGAGATVLALLTFGWSFLSGKPRLSENQINEIYAHPISPPAEALRVFHLGHSLVGRDVPAMLQQMSGIGHEYALQLGWGTPLKSHWEPDIPIQGFEEENATEKFRDAKEALGSGQFDAFVATEMVEIADAIKYHDSAKYLGLWADLAATGNPDARIYLYETWHNLDDPDGWLTRLDRDLDRYWEQELLFRATRKERPIHVIPVGQVFARFVRAVEQAGGVDNVHSRESLFRKDAAGERDPIHVGDLGAYLVALTHYAVLYHRSPVGLPRELLLADGSTAIAPGEQVARLMQDIVWQVVTSYPKSGVAQTP